MELVRRAGRSFILEEEVERLRGKLEAERDANQSLRRQVAKLLAHHGQCIHHQGDEDEDDDDASEDEGGRSGGESGQDEDDEGEMVELDEDGPPVPVVAPPPSDKDESFSPPDEDPSSDESFHPPGSSSKVRPPRHPRVANLIASSASSSLASSSSACSSASVSFLKGGNKISKPRGSYKARREVSDEAHERAIAAIDTLHEQVDPKECPGCGCKFGRVADCKHHIKTVHVRALAKSQMSKAAATEGI